MMPLSHGISGTNNCNKGLIVLIINEENRKETFMDAVRHHHAASLSPPLTPPRDSICLLVLEIFLRKGFG
jgi:hypothetical protein